MIGKTSLLISSIGQFRHATLLFTVLLLIAMSGCVANEKIDLKDRCMKYPLHLMCRGSVMKRGVSRMHNLEMVFDDYLRSKIFRTSDYDEFSSRRYNPLKKLTKKEREDLFEYYMSAQHAKPTNRSKLLEHLLRSARAESPGRYGRNAQDTNDAYNPQTNANIDPFLPLLESVEYK